LIERLALRGPSQLVVDRVIRSESAGGTGQGSGEMVVQYRQLIDGIPVISPGSGSLRVAIDNDGNVTRVDGSLREVRGLSARGRTTPPEQPDTTAGVSHADEGSPDASSPEERALASATGARLRSIVSRGKGQGPVGFSVVPGSTEVGYDLTIDTAELIATRTIEVDFGSGYRKLYRIDAPLFG
jgi:hypothetical protein